MFSSISVILTIIIGFNIIPTNVFSKKIEIMGVTNNEICTKMATKYINKYPNITAPELFIITSTCEGIVHPMDSGLGGGFQMVLYLKKQDRAIYINARESSGSKVPDQPGRTTKHIGTPSMLAGYQYLYNNLEKWGLKPQLEWYELFTENVNLAMYGFPISKTFHVGLLSQFAEMPNIWEISDDHTTLSSPVLASFINDIARYGPKIQPFYTKGYYMNKKLLSYELSKIDSYITAEDVRKYHVKEKRLEGMNCFNYTVYVGELPSSGLLQLFGCRLLEYAVKNLRFLSQSQEIQFGYKIYIEYYMYSIQMQLRNLNAFNQKKLVRPRNIKILSKLIMKKLKNKTPFPNTIATNAGLIILNLDNVRYINTAEHGTSNICLSSRFSDLCATSTINWGFGAGYSPLFGFFYNNQLADFTYYNPLNGNRPKPHDRPQSSISPTIFLDKSTKAFEFSVGAAGGKKIVAATFTITFNYIMQKLHGKKYDCIESQLQPRCSIRPIALTDTVTMPLICEETLRNSLKKYLTHDLKADVQYVSEAGYSAATTVVKGSIGCSDPRRGGKGFYKVFN